MKRRDLALLYFPDKSPVEAVRTLRLWIKNCPDLAKALNEISVQHKKKKNLTIKQVRLIMEYLGDP